MTTSSLNSAQHVERIREILIGRDLRQVNGRIDRLEDRLQNGDIGETPAIEDLRESFTRLENEQQALLSQFAEFKKAYEEQKLTDQARLNDLSSQLTALIDTRLHEIRSQLDEKLLDWKKQLEQNLQSLRDSKADRNELRHRFARLATALADEETPPSPPLRDPSS